MTMTLPRVPHILLVDETPEITALLGRALRHDGFQVTTVAETLSLELVRTVAPDLILLDLPFGRHVQATWRLLQALRADPDLQGTPVLLMTAASLHGRDPALLADLHQWALPVLFKPFGLATLAEHIALALDAVGTTR